ncbi:MAG: C13 family peptidase [Erythrobacter sp.]|uniref:C13 family peptidase n=1 Tax=Erythrobacter sp. TaxID=1042 RepID=UPI00262F853C|nr:C13 family peptidase [Erythrobacter sp.]MDJ0977905.1 C13 family peptidase [Erythrobacter sp.]
MTKVALIAGLIGLLFAVPAAPREGDRAPDPNQPPEHLAPYPSLATGKNRKERRESFNLGPQMQRGVPARVMLEQRRRLDAALARIEPQRRGTVDAYVVTIALDSDPVFAREAREAGRVLERRYDAKGRTLVLAGPDGARDDRPHGSIDALIVSLARVAEVMDSREDVLVLYSTSHGLDLGLTYHYGDTGYGVLSPARFKAVLEELGIKRRILLLSACFSGVFVDPLSSPDTAIFTAAASNRSSFGCEADNDWTFYGDALINNALRSPQSLEAAGDQAVNLVAKWEAERRLLASLPQVRIGPGVGDWLPELEARMPRTATSPVGRPAISGE